MLCVPWLNFCGGTTWNFSQNVCAILCLAPSWCMKLAGKVYHRVLPLAGTWRQAVKGSYTSIRLMHAGGIAKDAVKEIASFVRGALSGFEFQS